MSEQVYLIFGGTGSIGSAVCKKLTDSGATVIAAGRSANGDDTAGSGLAFKKVDATDPEAVEGCINEVVDEHGGIHGVANCVGSLLLKPAHLTSLEEWRETIDLNLASAFYILKYAAKPMMKQGGSVVLVSSAAARVGLSNHEAIAAAKAGIEGLTVSAAASYAKNGIRVNAVAPGMVRSQLTDKLTRNENMEQASIAMHALERLGEPEDVANAIAWLLQPEQSWVTGQVFGIDGGLARVRPRMKA